MPERADQAIREVCREIEQRHDLRTGFFAEILGLSDWALIIQCHALVEAALADALVSRFGVASLSDTFSRLPTSDAKVGKVAFAKAAGLISGDQAKFIQRLSESRNALVHKIGNVNFSLKETLAGCSDRDRDKWYSDIALANPVTKRLGQKKGDPHVLLFFAVVLMVYELLPTKD